MRKDSKLPLGRPSKYTVELADLICKRVAINPVGLPTICKMYDDMPDPDTIREWRHLYPDFSAKYLSSKAEQAMLMVEEIDDLLNYEVSFITDEKGNSRIDPPSASMAIARCNNRKWMAARLAPRIFGDNIKETISDDSLTSTALEHKKQLLEQHKKDH